MAIINKMENPPLIKARISGDDIHTNATTPVRQRAKNILLNTETMYFLRPLSNIIGPVLNPKLFLIMALLPKILMLILSYLQNKYQNHIIF